MSTRPARRSPLASLRDLSTVVGDAGLGPVLILMAVSAVERFDSSAFGILGPEIRKTFHLSNQTFVPIATLTGLLPLLLSVPMGYWSDRTNRVRLSWIGAIVWGVTAIATGLSPFVWFLAIARIAGGSGQLVNEVTHPSLLSDYYPPEALAPAYSFYGIAAGAVGLVAGPIAGVLGQRVGWRTTFVVLALPTFVLAAVVMRLKEPARGQSLGLVQPDEERTSMSEAFRRLRAVRSLRRTWLAAAFFGAGTASFSTYLSLFFNDVYHVKPAARGYIAALFGVVGLVGLAVGGKLSQDQVRADRPQRLPVINGLMIIEFAIGIFLMAIAPNEIARAAASTSPTRAACRCSSASTSRCRRARSSPSSAPTAPASRRCCGPSAACSTRSAAPSSSTAATSPTPTRSSRRAPASCRCPAGAACSRA